MALPGWLEPLPDAAQQRSLDEWAIGRLGMPGLDLMERAGSGLAEVCATASSGPIVVVCGGGNNGGDGLVAARLLREQGRETSVLLLGDPDQLRGDARTNLERLTGAQPEPFESSRLEGAACVVDAILGTGFVGVPREPAAGAITAINVAAEAGAVVVACDVPSGVDASTGEVSGPAITAHRTVTFHAAKPGLWVAPGKQHAGMVTIVDIGIPRGRGPVEPLIGLIAPEVTAEIPRRGFRSNKFTAGSVLVCGGSPGLTGAPAMAGMAAARAGAGYVTVATSASVVPALQAKLLEVMVAALPETDHGADSQVVAALERMERVDSVVLGPGLGREDGARTFARGVLEKAPRPLVLDADGLGAVAGAVERVAVRLQPTVLTPHTGELARLLESDSDAIDARRLASARQAADRSRGIVVLKGDDTIIVEPDGRDGRPGRIAISPGGAPALATAGTGDVLAGVLGAFLAKGMEPFTAACAAVHVHLTAGRLAAVDVGGVDGVIAGDVIAQLPRALAESGGATADRAG
jgi:ADP-dependent NAD(P)H-hydrate dehydratase / NAD(P)H-hydrate epimerase